MAVGSVSATSASTVQDRVPPAPKEVTKSGLEEMRSRIAESGEEAPEGLDTLIENFDDAAGSSGTMTFAQFKAFASENGVTLPDPPKGGGAASGETQSSMKLPSSTEQSGKFSSSNSSSSSTSSTTDVANASDSELQQLAAKGNQEAKTEIERRDAKRAAMEEDGVGTKVNAWA